MTHDPTTPGAPVTAARMEFLFNAGGHPIGALVGRNLVDFSGGWLGWVPWNDGDAFDPEGRYLGTITADHRLYAMDIRRPLMSPRPRMPERIVPPAPPRPLVAQAPGPGMSDVRPRPIPFPGQPVRQAPPAVAVAETSDAADAGQPAGDGALARA